MVRFANEPTRRIRTRRAVLGRHLAARRHDGRHVLRAAPGVGDGAEHARRRGAIRDVPRARPGRGCDRPGVRDGATCGRFGPGTRPRRVDHLRPGRERRRDRRDCGRGRRHCRRRSGRQPRRRADRRACRSPRRDVRRLGARCARRRADRQRAGSVGDERPALRRARDRAAVLRRDVRLDRRPVPARRDRSARSSGSRATSVASRRSPSHAMSSP